MKKQVRSVTKYQGQFRICIPKKLILLLRWGDVEHVLCEADGPDKIVIRRFVSGKDLKG